MKPLSAAATYSLAILVCLSLVKGVSSQCISNLTDIYVAELDLTDLSKNRTYILCPDTVFTPSDFTGAIVPNGDVPIFLRSNAMVKCGKDGSSANSCVIDGTGTSAIFMNPLAFGLTEFEVENVVVQGVTVNFYNLGSDPNIPIVPIVVGLSLGDVTFLDCIFSNNIGDPLFALDQYILSSRNLQDGPRKQMLGRELYMNRGVRAVAPKQIIDRELGDTEEGSSGGLSHQEHRQLQTRVSFTFDSCTFDVSLTLFYPVTALMFDA
jgi:hypothetical protein